MAFGSSERGTSSPLAEINMVPLIDVMLVLLVIFIITAPLLTHSVKINLPKASSQANQTKPDNVQVAIRANGETFWNGETVELSELEGRMRRVARGESQPDLHIRADRKTEYERVVEVMSMAARAGMTRIGFVTDPPLARP